MESLQSILLKNDFMKIMIMKEMDSVGKCKVYQVPILYRELFIFINKILPVFSYLEWRSWSFVEIHNLSQ